VLKVGENSFFFLVLYLSTNQNRNSASWGCKNSGNSKLQCLWFVTRIMLQKKKF